MKRKICLLLLSILTILCLVGVAGCGLTDGDNDEGGIPPSTEHVHAYSAQNTLPTCTEQGYTTHTCECGESYVDTYIDALGHNEVSHSGKSATCEEIGWEAYETCSRCDYSTYEEIKALGHDEQSHQARVPTCEEIGWETYKTCLRCDYSTYEEIKALGHDEQSHQARVPTCEEIGWEAYETCSRCDYSTYEEIKALGHDEQPHDPKEPNCEEIGWETYKTCLRCDYSTYEEIKATGHKWGDENKCESCGCDYYTPGLLFTLSEQEDCYIVSSGTATDENVVIPSKYKDIPVCLIAENGFKSYKQMTSIVIPKSVKVIGDDAFNGCNGLSVVYADDLVSWCLIDFSNSGGIYTQHDLYINDELIEDIVIPKEIEQINPLTFAFCREIKSVDIHNNVIKIGASAFRSARALRDVKIGNNVEIIDDLAFSGCSNIYDIVIPASVKVIGEYAFASCSFSNLEIGSGVEIIEAYAFATCYNLDKVYITDSVKTIGKSAFYSCSKTREIIIGSGVELIGEGAFSVCFNAQNYDKPFVGFDIDESNQYYKTIDGALCTKDGKKLLHSGKPCYVSSYTIPDCVETICAEAFIYHYYLKEIVIPDSVMEIEMMAFGSCGRLERVVLGEGVKRIGEKAFQHCSKLTNVVMSNNIESIAEDAFYNCDSIIYNELDNGKYLGNSQNQYLVLTGIKDKDIDTFEMSEQTKIIMASVFEKSKISQIVVKRNVIELHYGVFQYCENLANVIFEEGCKLTLIKNDMFFACRNLQDVVLPESIEILESSSFQFCSSLTSIKLSKTLTAIEWEAFADCTNLASIIYDGTVEQWNVISKRENWDLYTGDYTVYCTDGEIKKAIEAE